MGRAVLIPDDDKFPALWGSALTNTQIGDIYGVSAKVVSAKAQRDGLPARGRWRGAAGQRAKVAKKRTVVDDAPADDPMVRRLGKLLRAREEGTIPTPPFWTTERDSLILVANGVYTRLNALADDWGELHARVLGRWHIVRAA